ncbi:MAG: tripartite tricarboxylate transporter substrate-binding protein [Methyloceanibacter sp.]
MSKRIVWIALATVLVGGFSSESDAAEIYPSRPITLVMPYAAGGSADTLLRIIAERMKVSLGGQVIIENVTGAAGSIGTGRVARAAPDGYTAGLGTWSTHVANGAVYALPYDLLGDFQPIALIASSPILIAARNAMPARDLKELVAWLKANPDKATQGTNGSGSVMHLAGVLLQRETGTRYDFVPYRGAGSAMQDLLAGRIDLYLGLPADILPHARSGRVTVYAVAAKQRLAAAPGVPTVDEAGVPGLHVSAWFGLWAPKGTPRDVIGKLNAAAAEALADPSISQRLKDDLNLEVPPPEQRTPEYLGAYQKAEIEKWWPIIRGTNIKAE